MKTTSLEKVIYFQDYVVIDPGHDRTRNATTSDRRRISAQLANNTVKDRFEADMGAEAVRKLLMRISIWFSLSAATSR